MIELGLSRVHQLLARTPLPWRAIHVAGTNGKGSVCAYVSAMLSNYNQSEVRQQSRHGVLRHGRFNSPHLVDRWDCITLDGETVDKTLFESVEKRVLDRDKAEQIGASEFELLTATAFEIFTQAKVDIGVIEVGMGGRLDATNVIGQRSEFDDEERSGTGKALFRPAPLATAITSIALDHQGFLGDTVQQIAREKAGILKTNVPVIAAADDQDALSEVQARAKATGVSETVFVTAESTRKDVWDQNETDVELELDTDSKALFESPIQSRWPNGAIALHLVWKALNHLGRLDGTPKDARGQLFMNLAAVPGKTLWPGRLQEISLESLTGCDQLVVLDGAHNAQSAHQLSSFVRNKARERKVQWVLAASEGKDVHQILKILLRPGDTVSAVEFGQVEGMPWVKPKSSETIIQVASEVINGM